MRLNAGGGGGQAGMPRLGLPFFLPFLSCLLPYFWGQLFFSLFLSNAVHLVLRRCLPYASRPQAGVVKILTVDDALRPGTYGGVLDMQVGSVDNLAGLA